MQMSPNTLQDVKNVRKERMTGLNQLYFHHYLNAQRQIKGFTLICLDHSRHQTRVRKWSCVWQTHSPSMLSWSHSLIRKLKQLERQSSTDGSAGMELLWKLYLTMAKSSGINLQQNYTSDWTLSTPQQQPTTRNATLKQKYATKPLPSISTLLSTNLHWIGSNIWRQWPSHTTPACTDPSRPLHIS